MFIGNNVRYPDGMLVLPLRRLIDNGLINSGST